MCASAGSTANDGSLYDNGRPNGNYTHNQSCGYLINPDCASGFTFDDASFIHMGTGDRLRIFMGQIPQGN